MPSTDRTRCPPRPAFPGDVPPIPSFAWIAIGVLLAGSLLDVSALAQSRDDWPDPPTVPYSQQYGQPNEMSVVPAAYQQPVVIPELHVDDALSPLAGSTADAASPGTNLPLPAPRDRRTNDPRATTIGGPSSWATMAGSLGVVLGLFLLLAYVMRRAQGTLPGMLPSEVFQTLGRAPLNGREQVHLLRFGAKLLLVSAGPTGTETLGEITEPNEVIRLAGLCQSSQPNSATAAFRQVFSQVASGSGMMDADNRAGERGNHG